MGGQVLLKKLNAVDPRHFHIHGHHIGGEAVNFALGIHSIDGGAHHLDAGVGSQPLSNEVPGHHGVIHHQHTDGIVVGEHNIDPFFWAGTAAGHFF